ncbi:MAG: hypothetical protein RJA49_2836 [Actinomycetota bacterium]
MTTTVEPSSFKFVQFDADLIARITDGLVAAIGIDRPVHVVVDETTPLGRVRTEIGDDITIRVESGAFEDSRKPREQSELSTTASLGRALYRARDRISGGFGEAPPDDALDLRQVAAWETYCVGRLTRLGVPANEQRWKYNFRNRHGFNDTSDMAFDRIWSADGLTWGELESISAAGAAEGAPE